MTAAADPRPAPQPQPPVFADPATAGGYLLLLYITGTSPRSARAIVNVRAICDRHLSGRYELQVIDVSLSPGLARSAQLVAVPTLVKHRPLPICRFIGDMSQTEHILRRLDLLDAAGAP